MDSKQTIYRISKADNYTMLNRHLLEDARLSYEARGLLACMLAKPDDWIFHITFFIKNQHNYYWMNLQDKLTTFKTQSATSEHVTVHLPLLSLTC